MTNYYCKRLLQEGDEIAYRWGKVVCEECNTKYPAPFMAVYTSGQLSKEAALNYPGLKCGDTVLGDKKDDHPKIIDKAPAIEGLSKPEVGAILAGLRLLQQWLNDSTANMLSIFSILTDDFTIENLVDSEIDDLCERINFGEIVKKKGGTWKPEPAKSVDVI